MVIGVVAVSGSGTIKGVLRFAFRVFTVVVVAAATLDAVAIIIGHFFTLSFSVTVPLLA